VTLDLESTKVDIKLCNVRSSPRVEDDDGDCFVGKIYKQGKDSIQLVVNSIENINKIIQFFDNILITQKRADYELLKKAVEIINRGEHLTDEGFRKIIAIRASMNWGLSKDLKEVFTDVKPVKRPIVGLPLTIDSNWLTGFIEGEGNFTIKVSNSSETNSGKAIGLVFRITQHIRDILLMESFIKLLGCGRVKVRSNNKQVVDYIVSNLTDIDEKILPFLKKHPLIGAKNSDYLDLCKIVKLIKNKSHLTTEGLEEIIRIKAKMNKGRDHASSL